MRLKMIVFLVAAFCLCAVPSFAGSITGKYEAEMKGMGGPGGGGGQPMKFVFDFKEDGGKLTGTVKGPRATNEIQDGKVEGKTISFTINAKMGPNEMKINYKGDVVSDDEIKFTFSFAGGMGGPPGGGAGGGAPQMPPMVAKRVK